MRERVLDVQRRYLDRLRVEMNALATRLLFDDSNRAIGIKYLKGERLYRAHSNPNPGSDERKELAASREVILAGGAFNTPQYPAVAHTVRDRSPRGLHRA